MFQQNEFKYIRLWERHETFKYIKDKIIWFTMIIKIDTFNRYAVHYKLRNKHIEKIYEKWTEK